MKQCTCILQSGARIGMMCGAKLKDKNKTCGRHNKTCKSELQKRDRKSRAASPVYWKSQEPVWEWGSDESLPKAQYDEPAYHSPSPRRLSSKKSSSRKTLKKAAVMAALLPAAAYSGAQYNNLPVSYAYNIGY